MQYLKPALTFQQQVDLLLSRGMVGDRAEMESCLAQVNYYRLSAYWYNFRRTDQSLEPGTRFEHIWERYVFDRKLRLLVLDAIEPLEVAVRTQISYHHAHAWGPFGYYDDPRSLPAVRRHQDFRDEVDRQVRLSKDEFVTHFRNKYGSHHQAPPIWMATEIMTLGAVLRILSGSARAVRRAIAAPFQVPDQILESWLLSLNMVRNICAHHARLWNRTLGIKPKIPPADRFPDWHTPIRIAPDKVFAVLTISNYLLRFVANGHGWRNRLISLLDAHPTIPRHGMGFPLGWERSPLWSV